MCVCVCDFSTKKPISKAFCLHLNRQCNIYGSDMICVTALAYRSSVAQPWMKFSWNGKPLATFAFGSYALENVRLQRLPCSLRWVCPVLLQVDWDIACTSCNPTAPWFSLVTSILLFILPFHTSKPDRPVSPLPTSWHNLHVAVRKKIKPNISQVQSIYLMCQSSPCCLPVS